MEQNNLVLWLRRMLDTNQANKYSGQSHTYSLPQGHSNTYAGQAMREYDFGNASGEGADKKF